MKSLIEKIENTKISISDWISGFVCIIFVRFLLESISSPAPSGMMPTDPYTLFHYGLFFLAVALGLINITGLFTKNYKYSSKIVLFIFPIIWIAPLVDISVSRAGQTMSYIYALPKELIFDFLKFPLLIPVSGITSGMQVQIFLIYLFLGFYVWNKTKKYSAVVFSIVTYYVFMFVLGSLPSLIYNLSHLKILGTDTSQISFYLENLINNSNIIHNTLHEGAFSVSRFRFFQLGFDKLMSQILFVISTILTIIFFWKTEKEKLWIIIKNSRPIRITYYLVPMILSVGYVVVSRKGSFNSWVDFLGLLCLLVSWFGMWMYSVHINDLHDVEIDKVTNQNRPLSAELIENEDIKQSAYIYLALAVVGSWCAGFYSFFFVLVGLSVAYIYSAPPLRLRRVTFLSSFVIAIVILSAALSGFFFISFDKKIQSFPTIITLGIIIFYTLQINFKDIKDIEGDSKHDVKTVPVVFKEDGVFVTGLLFAFSFLLVPIFLNMYYIYLVSIPASFVGYKLITNKPYVEKNIFILQFVFVVGLIFTFFLTK